MVETDENPECVNARPDPMTYDLLSEYRGTVSSGGLSHARATFLIFDSLGGLL
jgi:hypothetical protein